MDASIKIELLPLGKTLQVQRGTSLQDLLFAEGVEFPCGGRGRCKGCRVRVLSGETPVTPEDQRLLTPEEIAGGWRLACRLPADHDLKLELAQWETAILTDESPLAFTPRQGLGVAVDLGTTTLVAQLLDLRTGHVLGVRSALNQQAQHGADIMSRVDFAVSGGGQARLVRLIREQIGQLVEALLASAATPGGNVSSTGGVQGGVPCPADLKQVVIVGNTVMHHLFCDVSVEPLAHHPFLPSEDGLKTFAAGDLGWVLAGNPQVCFLPCLGGFVGSDILAGILATRLQESDKLVGLIDLGTNGEIVIGNREGLLCASTAAGPAFEGARISMGMRAATGAISEVSVEKGGLRCRVLGHTAPRGICGSGLVDAVAGGLELGLIQPSGRLSQGLVLPLQEPVALTQADIRELQLAKGAIAAGIQLLLSQWGADKADLTTLHLAGAFGNYISRAGARRIGLIDFPPETVRPAGNTALRGAKLALLDSAAHDLTFPELRSKVQHVALNEDRAFHATYVEEMRFPG